MGRRGKGHKKHRGITTNKDNLGADLLFFTEKNLEVESSCEIIARANQATRGLVTIYTELDKERPGAKLDHLPLKVNILAGEKPWLEKNAGSHLWRVPKSRNRSWDDSAARIERCTRRWNVPSPWQESASLQWRIYDSPIAPGLLHQTAQLVENATRQQLAPLTNLFDTTSKRSDIRSQISDLGHIPSSPSAICLTKSPPTWEGQQLYDTNGASFQTTEHNVHNEWFKIGEPWSMAGTPGNLWFSTVSESPKTPPSSLLRVSS